MTDQPVTLTDIAAAGGVSVSTVSRALADDPQISSTTRARIRLLADELGYVPNIAARTLVRRRSTSLGLVIPDVTDPIHGQVASGFQQRASERGYSAVLANGLHDREAEGRALRELAAHRVGGVALMGCVLGPDEVDAVLGATPLVLVAPEHAPARGTRATRRGQGGRRAGTRGAAHAAVLRPDDSSGMRQVVAHLSERGYQRPCYVTGSTGATHAERLAALERALAEHGFPHPLVYRATGWTSSDLVDVVQRLRAEGRATRPDVAVCYDDKTALHLMDALRQAGVAVPAQLGIVGFDDIPFAAIANPRLTTVAQPSEEMGRRCVDLLVAAAEDDHAPRGAVLPVQLVVRETTPGPTRPRPRPRPRHAPVTETVAET
jgi:DNA-binding LacI/PurR family transcriptional regulator